MCLSGGVHGAELRGEAGGPGAGAVPPGRQLARLRKPARESI